MPDTLSLEEIALIRRHAEHGVTQDAANVRAILAHIDALTAAARWLVDNSTPQHTPECWLSVDEGQECICGVSERYIEVLAAIPRGGSPTMPDTLSLEIDAARAAIDHGEMVTFSPDVATRIFRGEQ